ncbi:unnamed protein product [Periconia digitata]|uniref:Uncharacterized protein n=1 Tax=Periconia digitata TaxID=1303443 RepID=A0A9W4U350_9PLEO|nr:unnamed protein product [Periconia digitata]
MQCHHGRVLSGGPLQRIRGSPYTGSGFGFCFSVHRLARMLLAATRAYQGHCSKPSDNERIHHPGYANGHGRRNQPRTICKLRTRCAKSRAGGQGMSIGRPPEPAHPSLRDPGPHCSCWGSILDLHWVRPVRSRRRVLVDNLSSYFPSSSSLVIARP